MPVKMRIGPRGTKRATRPTSPPSPRHQQGGVSESALRYDSNNWATSSVVASRAA